MAPSTLPPGDGDTARSRIAIFAGSFDPPTLGHEDLVRRALGVADRVVVAVAVNPNKQPLFSGEERVTLLRSRFSTEPRVEVRHFTGLLVSLAKEVGATLLIRGVRSASDFEYETQMAHMNRQLDRSLETVILVPSLALAHVSATLVREVARFGGSLDRVVAAEVAAALRAKFT